MDNIGTFPFGNKVKPVQQADRTPKDVFILGVYASAVHARWRDKDGKTLINALAVASEPDIFWRGQGTLDIIEEIKIPRELGNLEPAASNLNGPSGRSLDEEYLAPLGLKRNDIWLSDIYPIAHMNNGQKKAIEREYLPLLERYQLPKPTLLPAPTKEPGVERREEIWKEIEESRARIIILLGDKPIEWFLRFLLPEYGRLSNFGKTPTEYGRLYNNTIRGRKMEILPLVHPRQASRLGASSKQWYDLHSTWKDTIAPDLLG